MPSESKIDPTLQEQLRSANGGRVPVLIELADQPPPPPSLDRNEAVGALEGSAQAEQAGLMAQLHSFGLKEADITPLSIVNAVATSLSADEVTALTDRPDVAFIRYGGQANVAL